MLRNRRKRSFVIISMVTGLFFISGKKLLGVSESPIASPTQPPSAVDKISGVAKVVMDPMYGILPTGTEKILSYSLLSPGFITDNGTNVNLSGGIKIEFKYFLSIKNPKPDTMTTTFTLTTKPAVLDRIIDTVTHRTSYSGKVLADIKQTSYISNGTMAGSFTEFDFPCEFKFDRSDAASADTRYIVVKPINPPHPEGVFYSFTIKLSGMEIVPSTIPN